jgi:hypothetical protein
MAWVHHHPGWHPPYNILKAAISHGQRVGAYGVRFSGPDERDLAGEYFDASTDFGSTLGNGAATMLHHGQPLAAGMEEFGDVILPTATVRKDSKGLFVEATLDLSDPLQEAISQLVLLGALRWSSGSAAHIVRKSADGKILRWPPIEFSFTPTPCEPRLPAIRRL